MDSFGNQITKTFTYVNNQGTELGDLIISGFKEYKEEQQGNILNPIKKVGMYAAAGLLAANLFLGIGCKKADDGGGNTTINNVSAITTANYMPGNVTYETDNLTIIAVLGQKVNLGTLNNPTGTILIDSIGGIPEKFKIIYHEGENQFHEDLIEDTIAYREREMQQYVNQTYKGELGMLPPGTYTIKVSETDEYGNVNPMDSRRINSVLKSARLLENGGKYSFIEDLTPQPLTDESQVKGCIWLVMDKDGNGVSNGTYPVNSPGKPIVGVMLYSSKDTDWADIGGEFWDGFVRGEQDDAGSGAVKRLHFLADHKDSYKMFGSYIEKK